MSNERIRPMTMRSITVGLLGLISMGIMAPGAWAQVEQQAIVEGLESPQREDVIRALRRAESLSTEQMGQPLREALIRVAEQANSARHERMAALRRGETSAEDVQHREIELDILALVVRLEDPQTIPVLVGAVDTGTRIPRALADFGEMAAPPLLDMMDSSQVSARQVRGGLLALRFLVEDPGIYPLSAGTLDRIRQLAARRLQDPGDQLPDLMLRRVIDLAVVLDHPDLRATVASLASDPEAVKERVGSLEDHELLRQVQMHAAERLAGVPPVPPRH